MNWASLAQVDTSASRVVVLKGTPTTEVLYVSRVCRPWSVEFLSRVLRSRVLFPSYWDLGLSGDAQIYRPSFLPLALAEGRGPPVAASFN